MYEVSARKQGRACAGCGMGHRPGDPVKYSRHDRAYRHGACRPGKPAYGHGKRVENREWYQKRKQGGAAQKVVVPGENAPEVQEKEVKRDGTS